jgi:hypothetical protein
MAVTYKLSRFFVAQQDAGVVRRELRTVGGVAP